MSIHYILIILRKYNILTLANVSYILLILVIKRVTVKSGISYKRLMLFCLNFYKNEVICYVYFQGYSTD